MQRKLTTKTKVVRPGQIRHIVLAAICLLYLISYVDRVTISVAAPKISHEFHFTPTEMGFIFSAFSFAYSLLPIFVGTFGDRLGPRRVLSLLMAWWSIFTALTGVVTSFISFFIVRLLFGLGESGSFPVATRALASWYPPSARGFLQGVTHAASRIGAAISAPIIVAIVIIFGGWRWSFYLLGIIGIIWAILFYFFFRDKPTEVATVSESEIALINQGRTRDTDSSKANPPVPWRKLLQGKDIWVLSIIQFIYGYTFWIYLTWLPTYLTDSRHFSFVQLGIVASLPLFGGVLGDVLGGWISDALYKRTGKLNLARRIVILIAFLGAAAFTIPAQLVSSALVAELLLVGTMFMLECSVSSTWAVAMDIGGEYYSGTTSGFVSTAFGIAGIVAPILFGLQREWTGSWIPGFFTGSVLLVIGAFIVFLVNANNTLHPNEIAPAASDEEANKTDEAALTISDEEKRDATDSIYQPVEVARTDHADEPVASHQSDEHDESINTDEIEQTSEADNAAEPESVEKVGETDETVLAQADEIAQGGDETLLANTNASGEIEEANDETILAASDTVETIKEVDGDDSPDHPDEVHKLDQANQIDVVNKVDVVAVADEIGSTNHANEAHKVDESTVIDVADAPAGSEAIAQADDLTTSPIIEETAQTGDIDKPATIDTPLAIEATEAVKNQADTVDAPTVSEENHQVEATSTPAKPARRRTRQVKSKADTTDTPTGNEEKAEANSTPAKPARRTRQVKSKADKVDEVEVNKEDHQTESTSTPVKPTRRPSQKRSTKSKATQ